MDGILIEFLKFLDNFEGITEHTFIHYFLYYIKGRQGTNRKIPFNLFFSLEDGLSNEWLNVFLSSSIMI